MSSTAVSSLGYYLQEGLRNFDLSNWMRNFDLANTFKDFDLKTFGWLALVVVAVIFIADLFTKPFFPLGRSLAVSAADAWQKNRHQITFDKFGRDSRSLEPVTEVLDALADAVKKWEQSEETILRKDRSSYGGRDLWQS
ncbi:uncharacterized protein LOC135220197 [Macrobrachium nipponense]|uniref:uncharacterized protein LOC135220197 n=1 Tax=Macrobrachium nipponense TaxID=159736 RepID=UPI0030C866F5